MVTQSLREYGAKIAADQAVRGRSEHLADALALVKRQCVIDLVADPVRERELTLEVLLAALLQFSLETHFIKFDPWDPTIEIKSFPPSFLLFQYNPFRDIRNRQATGQKPAAPGGAKVDFLAWETFPEAEHYLVWTAGSGRRYGILVQPVPIVPDHLIIASLDHDPATNAHYPQAMTAAHLADMHELQTRLEPLGYAMGFNDHQAGASVDHFHTQAVFKDFLPFPQAYAADALAIRKVYATPSGVQVKILENRSGSGNTLGGRIPYPACGLVLEAPKGEALLHCKQIVLQEIIAAKWVYNSLGWRSLDGCQAEVFFPRGQEYILDHGLKAGYVEMSGMLVIPDHDRYQSLTESAPGENALREAGPSPEKYDPWLTRVLQFLLK